MEDMTMTEIARLIEGLRSAGWEEKKINDFLLYIESGSEEFKPKEEKQKQIRHKKNRAVLYRSTEIDYRRKEERK